MRSALCNVNESLWHYDPVVTADRLLGLLLGSNSAWYWQSRLEQKPRENAYPRETYVRVQGTR